MTLTKFIGYCVGTGIALIGLAAPSSAQTFSGTSSGTFGTPNPGSNDDPVFSGVGTNTFRFGDPGNSRSNPNRYTFAGNSFSTTPGSLFRLGNFTYFNGATFRGTTVDSVPLNVSLGFTNPSGVKEVFRFDLQNNSTPNTGTPEQNADFVFPINSISAQSFTVGATKYTLVLNGFSRDGGVTTVNEFRVLEGRANTAEVFGTIIAAPVPEPTSMLGILAFSALGGGSLLKRKRQQMNKVNL